MYHKNVLKMKFS